MSKKKLFQDIFKNRNWKVRLIQVLNHACVLSFLLNKEMSFFDFIWVVLIYFFMFCVGVNIGVHRYFTHKSFKTSSFVEMFLFTSFTLATVGSTIAWVGMHREHHKFSDTDADPHTPVCREGGVLQRFSKFLRVYFGIWDKYTAKPRYTTDIRRSAAHRFFHFNYIAVIVLYALVLYFVGGWKTLVLGYCFPAVLVFHAASFIVTYGHTFGYSKHDTKDFSKNSLLLHVITFGEGLHNEHHAYPYRYRYESDRWYMFDLPGWIIESFLMKGTVKPFKSKV